MKKYLANIITSSRIIGAIYLFCCSDFTNAYLAVYCYCGFSDFIDGPIARKTGSSSALGAALDTIGDVLTYLSMIKILVIQGLVPGWLLAWLGVLIAFGFVLAGYSLKKFKKFYIPHTYLGKMLGFMLFVMPVAMRIVTPQTWEFILLTFLTVVAVEAFIVQIRSDEPVDFVPSIFHIDSAKQSFKTDK